MDFSNAINHYETSLRGLNTAGLDGTYPEGGAIRGGSGKLYEDCLLYTSPSPRDRG